MLTGSHPFALAPGSVWIVLLRRAGGRPGGQGRWTSTHYAARNWKWKRVVEYSNVAPTGRSDNYAHLGEWLRCWRWVPVQWRRFHLCPNSREKEQTGYIVYTTTKIKRKLVRTTHTQSKEKSPGDTDWRTADNLAPKWCLRDSNATGDPNQDMHWAAGKMWTSILAICKWLHSELVPGQVPKGLLLCDISLRRLWRPRRSIKLRLIKISERSNHQLSEKLVVSG